MSIIDKIPDMTDDQLQVMRRNAKKKLEDPKSEVYALEVLKEIDRQLELRHIPGMIETYKERNPGGFYGEQEARDERDYKAQAAAQFMQLLGKPEFERLLADNSYAELENRVTRLVNSTNFIQGSFEKPILLDTVKENTENYMNALFDFIWGHDQLDQRFTRFVEFSESLKLAKWTYVTYFLFLSDTDRQMFVKPEMLKRSLEISRYPVEYESTPSYNQYLQILEFSKWLKANIAELEPRDMIDVHSFMWHMAPTGKWAR